MRYVDLLTSTNLKIQLAAKRRELKKISLVKKPSEKTSTPSIDSKNQAFRQLPYDESILKFIEDEKLGKITRKRVAKSIDPQGDPNRPLDLDEETLKMFEGKCHFAAAAIVKESFPIKSLREVAFIGRSNVGKSSLLNALTNGGMARVSEKPGKTQSINFFEYEHSKKFLVDMPGYGFAYAKDEKVKNWNELVLQYIQDRKELVRLFVLIDSRNGLKINDREFVDKLNQTKAKYQIILTKSDQVLPLDLARRHFQISEELKHFKRNMGPPLIISAHSKGGLGKLGRILSSLLQL